MKVFKIITPSDRTEDKTEVTRWIVKGECCAHVWDDLIARLKKLFKTRSSQFFISWFDGTDYCTIREYADLMQAVEFFAEQGSADKAIRLFVSPDTIEHRTIFGEKPVEEDDEVEDLCSINKCNATQEIEEPPVPEQPAPADEVVEQLAETTLTEEDTDEDTPDSKQAVNPVPAQVPVYPAMPMYPYMFAMGQPGQQPVVYPQWPAAPMVTPTAPVPVPEVAPVCEPEAPRRKSQALSAFQTIPTPSPPPAPAPASQPKPVILNKLPTKPGETKPASKNSYVNMALQTLRSMGFTQDEKVLKKLIKVHKGNLNQIIDVLQTGGRA